MHVLYKVANAPIQPYPYPHIYVRDVFPEDYYRQIRANLPPREACENLKAMGRVGPDYSDDRFVMMLTPDRVEKLAEPARSFWVELAQWMFSELGSLMLAKFEGLLNQRFGKGQSVNFYQDALIVQDYTRYSLGPHTDHPKKVISLLFYLPPDASLAHLGTSMYRPKDRSFTCGGGPHYDFKHFERVMTMPYVPNTLFAFLKTPVAFHGVEPIQEPGIRRDLLLYDIQLLDPPSPQGQSESGQKTAPTSSNFTF